jgi:hypothetical protein
MVLDALYRSGKYWVALAESWRISFVNLSGHFMLLMHTQRKTFLDCSIRSSSQFVFMVVRRMLIIDIQK